MPGNNARQQHKEGIIMKSTIVKLFNCRSATVSQREMNALYRGGTDTMVSDAQARAALMRLAI